MIVEEDGDQAISEVEYLEPFGVGTNDFPHFIGFQDITVSEYSYACPEQARLSHLETLHGA